MRHEIPKELADLIAAQPVPTIFTPRFTRVPRREITYEFVFVSVPVPEVVYWRDDVSSRRVRHLTQIILTADPRYETSQQNMTLTWWMPHTLNAQIVGYSLQNGWANPYDKAITWRFTIQKKKRTSSYLLRKGIIAAKTKRRKKK